MTHRCSERLARWMLGAAIVVGAASPAAAGCQQADQLLARGFSVGQVAVALGAPVGAVQACLQAGSISAPPSRAAGNAAGPAPFGAAGPAPFGAAGPAPFGAAGPAPLGAAGPAPLGAAGPAPASGTGRTTR